MLAHAFQLAGSSSSAEDDPLFGNVHVHLDVEPQEADESSHDSAQAPQVHAILCKLYLSSGEHQTASADEGWQSMAGLTEDIYCGAWRKLLHAQMLRQWVSPYLICSRESCS